MPTCPIHSPCDCAACQPRRVLQLVVNAAFKLQTLRRAEKLVLIHPHEPPQRLLGRLIERVNRQANHYAAN